MSRIKMVWIDDEYCALSGILEPFERERERYHISSFDDFDVARRNIDAILDSDLIILDIVARQRGAQTKSGQYSPESRRPGLQFLRELRTQHHYSKPVVVFTVLGEDDGLKGQLLPYNVDDLIRKGIRPSFFKPRIDAILSKAGLAGE